MKFGFVGTVSDEEKKKTKQQEEAAAAKAKKQEQAKRHEEAEKAGKHEDDEDEAAGQGKPAGQGRPGRRRPVRHGKAEEEEEEEDVKPASARPGRNGRNDDAPEAEGEEEEEEDVKPPLARPGRNGRNDAPEAEGEEEQDVKPALARPGRNRRNDAPEAEEEEEEDVKLALPALARPGNAPKAEEEEEEDVEHAKPASARPGRNGRKDDKEDEPEAAGKPGRHGKAKEEVAAQGGGKFGSAGHTGAASEATAAGGEHGKQQQQHAPAHGSNPMQVDQNDPNAEHAKIEAQRKKDQAERIRLQKIADNQPEQPDQSQKFGSGGSHSSSGGGSSGCGGTVTVKAGESIQDALKNAQPGTTILLEAGTYNESLKTRVDGTKEKPITIKGPSSGATAIVKGDDKSGACVEINHDFYVLDDFTICGQISEHCNKNNVRKSFREKCLIIRGTREHRSLHKNNGDHFLSSVDGVVVKNMKINNCGGEGIRLRYFVTNCTLFHNCITSTGCFDFKFGGDQGKKNGEGIYIGTSSKQWEKNLTCEQDICRFNRVYENYIDTHGNECVDVKEGAMDTIIETNYCTGQLDEDSGGIDSRASTTIIRYNKVVGCKGAGVRLGGHKVGNDQYGIACQVYCNILENNEYGGIKVMTEPHQICQNTITGPGRKYKAFRGDCADKFEEDCECPFDVNPPAQDIETTKWFQNCKP